MTSFIAISCPSGCPLRSEVVLIDKATASLPHGRWSRSPACVAWAVPPRRLAPSPPRQGRCRLQKRAYGRSSLHPRRTTMVIRVRWSAGQKLGQFPRSPSNRVDQKLAVSSSMISRQASRYRCAFSSRPARRRDRPGATRPVAGDLMDAQHGTRRQPSREPGDLHQPRRHTSGLDRYCAPQPEALLSRAGRLERRRLHIDRAGHGGRSSWNHLPSLTPDRGFRLMQPTPLTSACRSPRRCFWQLLQHVHPPHPRPRPPGSPRPGRIGDQRQI